MSISKTTSMWLCAVIVSGVINSAQADQSASPGETRVARWKGDKKAALLLTFDDSLASHVKNVIPELKKRGMVGTFYVNPAGGQWKARKDAWEKEIPTTGMEYGNHTMTHKGVRDVADAEEEIGKCNEVILRLFPQAKQPRLISFGIPGVPKGAWNITDEQLRVILAKHHLVLRPKYEIAPVGRLKTADDLMRVADASLATGDVKCLVFHGVGGEWLSIPLPEFLTFLEKLATKHDRLWVAGAIAAHKYETERATAEVRVLQANERQVHLQVNCKTDSNLYDFPLTLVTRVPKDWKRCRIVQRTSKTVVPVANGIVRYEAMPDGKVIVLHPE